MKFCKDCKHFDAERMFCNHPKAFNKIDVITGERYRQYKWASVQRSGGWFCGLITNTCGNGRWFEVKND
jgi:hypothetical protein